jgi:hypothetical protein
MRLPVFVLMSLLQQANCLPIVDPGERSPMLRIQAIVALFYKVANMKCGGGFEYLHRSPESSRRE